MLSGAKRLILPADPFHISEYARGYFSPEFQELPLLVKEKRILLIKEFISKEKKEIYYYF